MHQLFVFCADLHLEDGAWSSRPGIYGDAYYSFAQIIDYCIEHRLPLILGGDVLEKKQNLARPIAKLFAGLSRMQSVGLDVYYIQGNHEYDRNAPWLSAHPWPVHLHEKAVNFSGVSVYGLDWLPRGDIQVALKAVPENTDILVTHQVWHDFMGSVGRIECALTDVHNTDVVLAGDFHVTKIVEGVNAHGDAIRMLSPGSTAMQDVSEAADKFFAVVGIEDDRIEFEFVQLKTRRFANYVVKDVDALDQLCAGQLVSEIAALKGDLPPEIDTPFIRIKFDKSLPDAYLRLMTTIGDKAHASCEAIAEKHGPKTIGSRETAKNDLLSAVATLLGDTSPAYKLAAALLDAPDPARALDAQLAAYLGESDDAAPEAGSP